MIQFTDFDITVDKIPWFSELVRTKEWRFNTMEHPDPYEPCYYNLKFITEGSQKNHYPNMPVEIQKKGSFVLSTSKRIPLKSFSDELPYRYYVLYFYTTKPLPGEIFTNGSCVLTPKETEKITLLYLRAKETYFQRGICWQMELKTILNELLTIFFKNLYRKDTKKNIPTLASTTRDIIEKRLSDKALSVAELAKLQYVSQEHLIRTYREAFGETPKQHITRLRLERSFELLKSTSIPIAEISEISGFSSQIHFARLFKEHYGITPSQFRKDNNPEFFFSR